MKQVRPFGEEAWASVGGGMGPGGGGGAAGVRFGRVWQVARDPGGEIR